MSLSSNGLEYPTSNYYIPTPPVRLVPHQVVTTYSLSTTCFLDVTDLNSLTQPPSRSFTIRLGSSKVTLSRVNAQELQRALNQVFDEAF